MKTIIYTILLFKLVHSSCHLRSIQSCLNDEQCQLVIHECQNRPSRCEDIDATNPNNCNGIQCQYNFELKICQSYEDEYEINSRRILDHNDNKNYQESENQHHDNNQQNDNHNQNQDGEYHNQSQNTTQDIPPNNDTTSTNNNQPEGESNPLIISNSTGSYDQSTNSTSSNSTDVLAFEMLQLNLNQDKILNSNLDEKDLVINTSSYSITLIATVILAKLFI